MRAAITMRAPWGHHGGTSLAVSAGGWPQLVLCAIHFGMSTFVAQAPDTRPNIVLLVVDQWRGDCLGIDRHPVVHTPFLDQMALDGARFTHAYSAVPSCIAARAALMTGLSQRSHGRVGYLDGVSWDYPTTLAGEFTRHGYQTQAIGKLHAHPQRSQLGFQNVILHDGFLHFGRDQRQDPSLSDDYLPWLRRELGRPFADYFDHGVNCNSVVARPWDKEEYLHPTNWIVDQGIQFLRRRDPRKPFFLNLSFHRPHPPYDPPAWAFEQYLHREMPPPPVGDWVGDVAAFADPSRPDCYVGDIDPHVLQRARAGYYGHMTHIDHQLNRFFEHLQQFGVLQNTYLCFVSDHGEMLGDHHMFRKGYAYEGSARVPLLLKGPNRGRVPKQAVCPSPVELRDVMPTLLDLAGAAAPSGVEGQSLLPLLRGEAASARPYVHGEHTIFKQSMQWITDGREKFVWYSGSGREQFFDLAADPQERRDLLRTPAGEARAARWRNALVQELTGREEGFTDGTRLIAGRPVLPCLQSVLPT
jgi:arylsulfatase A-like enzyme